jgi:hypothetical protein
MQSKKKEQGQNAESVATRARRPRRRTSPPAYPLEQRRKAVQRKRPPGHPMVVCRGCLQGQISINDSAEKVAPRAAR